MFFMCIDRGCVGKWDSKIYSVCLMTDGSLLQVRLCYVLYVLIEGALVHGRVSYVLYVY